VRHLPGPVEAGFHRIAWDLRYPPVEAWQPLAERSTGDDAAKGVLAAPGTYSVSMHKRIDGQLTDTGQSQSFKVVSIRKPTLPGSTQEERVVFDNQVNELLRATQGTLKSIDAAGTEIAAIKDVLSNSTADGSLHARAQSLLVRLQQQRDRLSENSLRAPFNDLAEVPVDARLAHARFDPTTNAYGPTPAQRESLRIARKAYDDVTAVLSALVDGEYAQLKRDLDAAGVPWSPGRGIQ